MSYVKSVMKRANLQQLREFLLTGVENEDVCTVSYEKRLKEALNAFMEQAGELNMKEETHVYEALLHCLSEHEVVYTEIGILCGFKLCKEIFEKETKL